MSKTASLTRIGASGNFDNYNSSSVPSLSRSISQPLTTASHSRTCSSASTSSSQPNSITRSITSFIPDALRRHRTTLHPQTFSKWSSPSIPDGGWACEDFMVGVGMVVIQPSTNKMVVLYDHADKRPGCYFLPRGRKDLGETLQEAVLREAYEESGFEVDFLPLYKFNRQPTPPADRTGEWKPDNEPIYMTTRKWGPIVRQGKLVDKGGEYFISWFIGQIPENATYHRGVGMPNEQAFQTFLVPFDEALDLINHQERPVVQYAQHLYRRHLEWAAYLERLRTETEQEVLSKEIDGGTKGIGGEDMEIQERTPTRS
ncbi:hypothetical protein J3R30DRAFT_3287959 [Lentinula aciculospora]|uniref:Nudix hydrolase domain-containing protein n=1 Tax=Lentinula aciculospora TaxID=153920 RepID=A0A9W9DQ08_9AGAR|nr:hypothetical protein J3R30DRAFT_3287959 [Lentinula aciculospora]